MNEELKRKTLRSIIENFDIRNPELISDGHGDSPDFYRMSEIDIQTLIEIIINQIR